MRRLHCARRALIMLGGLICTAGSIVTIAPTAFASPLPAPGTGDVPGPPGPINTLVVGGLTDWQVTLIAIGSAILGALAALIAGRAWMRGRAALSTS
jgi:hypothetical protein